MKRIALNVFGFLLLINVGISSCTDKEATPLIIGGRGIYVAGTTTNPKTGNSQATVWKDGVPIYLTDGSANAYASSIIVVGPDVYVLGIENDRKYWRNGIPVTAPTQGSLIFASGSDIYMAGNNDKGVIYWKNGNAFPVLKGNGAEYVSAIFVSGVDVYLAGVENRPYFNWQDSIKTPSIAKYWKNGDQFSLTDGIKFSNTTSIAVSGSDVFVGGWEYNVAITTWPPLTPLAYVAKYWKNGVAVNLTDGTHTAEVLSIAVSGEDVYAAGYEYAKYAYQGQAKYWKNGVAVNLTNGDCDSRALSIAISGSDVYVAGYERNLNGNCGTQTAVYWKNGTPVPLSSIGNFSGASSIFVVP